MCAISSLTSTFAISSPDEFLSESLSSVGCDLRFDDDDDDDDDSLHKIWRSKA